MPQSRGSIRVLVADDSRTTVMKRKRTRRNEYSMTKEFIHYVFTLQR